MGAKIKTNINLQNMVVFLLILLALICFAYPFINVNNNDIKSIENSFGHIKLTDVAVYLKFLFNTNKISTTFNIALHNFSIAFIAYILSIISSGILAILPFCSSFYIAGAVIKTSHDIPTVIFVTLEVLGMCISVFDGMKLYVRRTKNATSLKKVAEEILIVILILVTVYSSAAFIECNLISKIWSPN